jgi:di/tripeptidase
LRFSALLRFCGFAIAHIIKHKKNVNEKREKRTTMKDYSLKTVRHLTNQQRTELAMLLRYRTQTPKEQPHVYATLQEIAKTLGRSISWV